MKAGLIRLAAGVLAVLISLTCTVRAQEYYAQASEDTEFSAERLDQLLSPVALYPDPLLAQILIASTYPLEVVEAARWVQKPGNAALKGDQLAAALESMDWDPSVKSLVPFPQVLRMMDGRLDWMEQLGDAFLAQPDAVTDSVQRLRRAAYAAGTLRSNSEQSVTDDGSTIVIVPANPEVVYIPVYDPRYVYGPWWYPDYPPLYLYPPGYVIARDVILFGVGVFIVRSLWDWNHWDWRHHRIEINVARFNSINVHRPRITTGTWQHDSFHRRSVPYRDSRSRQLFDRSRSTTPEPPRSFRGYVEGPRAAPAQRTPPSAPTSSPRGAPQPRIAPPSSSPPSPRAVPQGRRTQRVVPSQPPGARTPPPAFEGIGRGHDVRNQETRGRASIQTMPQRTQRAPMASPPGGGSGRTAGGAGSRGGGQPRR